MIYLVIYDIGPDKVRNKVARRLQAEGYERLQLSVFMGLQHPRENSSLWNDLQQWLATDASSKLFALAVTENSLRNMAIIGAHALDFDYLTGSKEVLFI